MSNLPATRFSPIDYDAIEAAVVETERGRWFLNEYSQRNRNSDTRSVLGAIERLQDSVNSAALQPAASIDANNPTLNTIRRDLLDLAQRIAETHTEVAAIGLQDHDPKHVDVVSGELDAIVRSTELATSEILESAEQIQEIAWTMREGGLAVETCDALDARATNIYLACSFQDLTAQRTTKVIETMRYLENRINKMIGILQGVEGFEISADDSHSVPAAGRSRGLSADSIDGLLAQDDVDFAMQWESSNNSNSGVDHSAFDAPAVPSTYLDTSVTAIPDEEMSSSDVEKLMDADGFWLDEEEISKSLDNLEPPVFEKGPKGAVLHLASTNMHVDAVTSATPETVAIKERTRLEELDAESLDKKLSLFT